MTSAATSVDIFATVSGWARAVPLGRVTTYRSTPRYQYTAVFRGNFSKNIKNSKKDNWKHTHTPVCNIDESIPSNKVVQQRYDNRARSATL